MLFLSKVSTNDVKRKKIQFFTLITCHATFRPHKQYSKIQNPSEMAISKQNSIATPRCLGKYHQKKAEHIKKTSKTIPHSFSSC